MDLDKKMEELNKIRDDKLHELEIRRDKNLETLKKMVEDTNNKQNEKIDLMACQVQEMYEVFTSTNFVLKMTVRIFGAIGVITGSIIGCMELFKRVK